MYCYVTVVRKMKTISSEYKRPADLLIALNRFILLFFVTTTAEISVFVRAVSHVH